MEVMIDILKPEFGIYEGQDSRFVEIRIGFSPVGWVHLVGGGAVDLQAGPIFFLYKVPPI